MIAGGVPWQKAMDDNLKDGTSKQAFSAAKNFFKELFAAEEKTKVYMVKKKGASDIVSSGNEALKAYDDADKHLKDLIELLSGGKKVSGERGTRQLSESSTSPIDNLIESIVKKKLLK